MKKYLISICLLFGLLPFATLAAELKSGETYTSSADDIIADDLYVAAGMVSAGGLVEGDLIAAGGKVLVGGDVAEDLILAGGDLIILGDIGDDARIVGGNITVTGNVGGDLIVVGGNVQVASTANVVGDIVAGSGVLIIDGIVEGDVKVASGSLVVNGTINGNVIADSEEIELTSSAVVNGVFNYKSPKEANISEGAELNGGVNFEKRKASSPNKPSSEAIIGLIGLAWLGKLAIQLVAALVLLWLAPKLINSVAQNAVDKFGAELLRGFVLLVVTPAVVIILAFTVIGVFLAVPIGLVYVATLMLSKVLAGVTLGAILLKWFKSEKPLVSWKSVVLGVVVINIVTIIPLLGWIIGCLLFLATLGSLSYNLYIHLNDIR
jgi:cytoskeletal protein CcmA (bactofilin family)